MNENGNNQSQNKLSCNIVRDLLPNYIEHVTSPRTNEEMEMHLRECRECKNTYLNLTKDLGIEKMEEQEEMEYVKDGLIKARRMYMLKGIAETVILLALLVPGGELCSKQTFHMVLYCTFFDSVSHGNRRYGNLEKEG